jgi:hypothetical protein
MLVVLILLAVGATIVALRIISALKTAHSARKELDDRQTAASTDRTVSSIGTARVLPGAGVFQDQQTSREEKTVPTNTGGPLSGADARGGTGIKVRVPPAVSPGAERRKSERKGKWIDSHYCWVVLCKNHWFHLQQNLFFRHRIPLAATDPVTPRPTLEDRFRVRCDDCRKEYLYKPSEVLKSELELPDSFIPHPLLRDR